MHRMDTRRGYDICAYMSGHRKQVHPELDIFPMLLLKGYGSIQIRNLPNCPDMVHFYRMPKKFKVPNLKRHPSPEPGQIRS